MLSKNFYKLMVRKALTFYSLSQIKNIYLKRKKEKKRKERQMHNILFDFHRIYGTIRIFGYTVLEIINFSLHDVNSGDSSVGRASD